MSGLHNDADKKRFLTVLADGKFHERVDEDVEGAKVRTKKDQDGTSEDVLDKDGNTIYELTYPGFTGIVQKIQFFEGDYGTNLSIDIKDDEDTDFTISLSCSSSYGERMMEVLPNLDLTKELTFKPYSFTPKGQDRKVRGMNIFQDEKCEEKIFSAFTEKDGDKWKVIIKDFPMPDPKKSYNSEKWKTFFATRREWLMDYLVENNFVIEAEAPTQGENKTEGDDKDF